MPGSLRTGDIVVTNFGGTETGTTLVRFPNKMGPGHLFNTMSSTGTKGPSMEAFNTLTGTDWVANRSGNNVQLFKSNGTIMATITSPLFNGPWGQAFNHGIHNPHDGSVASFFSTNASDGTIDRIDVIPTKSTTTFRVFQIGQLAHMGKDTFIAVTWIPSLQMKGRHYSDVLLATDPVNNRIAAYADSTTLNTTTMRSTSQGMTVLQGLPLQTPAGIAINPFNGDLLVVNAQRNNVVEINLSRGKVVGDRLLDNVPVDPATGTGSALFGIVATADSRGNLEVFFTDDNTNTLDVLSV
jgi:DNA-binding beta-propeller fold protein YncE